MLFYQTKMSLFFFIFIFIQLSIGDYSVPTFTTTLYMPTYDIAENKCNFNVKEEMTYDITSGFENSGSRSVMLNRFTVPTKSIDIHSFPDDDVTLDDVLSHDNYYGEWRPHKHIQFSFPDMEAPKNKTFILTYTAKTAIDAKKGTASVKYTPFQFQPWSYIEGQDILSYTLIIEFNNTNMDMTTQDISITPSTASIIQTTNSTISVRWNSMYIDISGDNNDDTTFTISWPYEGKCKTEGMKGPKDMTWEIVLIIVGPIIGTVLVIPCLIILPLGVIISILALCVCLCLCCNCSGGGKTKTSFKENKKVDDEDIAIKNEMAISSSTSSTSLATDHYNTNNGNYYYDSFFSKGANVNNNDNNNNNNNNNNV